jgi:hypothetical protein
MVFIHRGFSFQYGCGTCGRFALPQPTSGMETSGVAPGLRQGGPPGTPADQQYLII